MPKTDPPTTKKDKVTPAGGGGRGPALAPGVLIGGKFRIEDRLARGGQATVYSARQEPLDRRVALKILSPPSLESTEEEREAFEQRFLLEARTLASLDHPNIVTVFDYGETDDGRYYLAMEYIEGGRFLDLLKPGRLEPGRVVGLVMQVCRALRYAHKRGVVHRDVKNSNVLVRSMDNGEEQAKVVDFGLVKLSRMDTTITQTGMILGSPHFMAPEQATGQGVDHRVDIYATGVLLFCGLVGKYPFDGPHATAIITAHVTRPVPTFKSMLPDVRFPEGLEKIVRRCLEKKPGQRYPSMDALMADLTPFHSGPMAEGISGEYHTLTGHTVETKRDWTAIGAGMVVGGIIAVALALLAATAMIGVQLSKPDGDAQPETPQAQAPLEAVEAQPEKATEAPEAPPKPATSATPQTTTRQPPRATRTRSTPVKKRATDRPQRATPSAPSKTESEQSDETWDDDGDLRDPWTE